MGRSETRSFQFSPPRDPALTPPALSGAVAGALVDDGDDVDAPRGATAIRPPRDKHDLRSLPRLVSRVRGSGGRDLLRPHNAV